MTAIAAKTKHRKEWAYIHQSGCSLLHIKPNEEIERFVKLAQFISNFTDQYNHPPRTRDFLQISF